jgi:hypothetical protein
MAELPTKVQDLLRALFREPEGQPGLRRAAADRAARAAGGAIDEARDDVLPAALAPWVDKVAERAWTITDEDLAAVRAAGLDEDAVYEATVAAAVGAALTRMQAGLRALAGER